MSHVTGTVQPVTPPKTIGPASGDPPISPGLWAFDFAPTPAPGGTKLLILHFQNVSLPANNRLEVDLGYDTDVFRAADGATFWTRPINPFTLPGGKVPIRYVVDGAMAGSAQLDQYGRGESHAGESGHPSISNSDPFLPNPAYAEPTYDPFWYCAEPPNWENAACVAAADVRGKVARSVGMIVSVHGGHVSTCSVTLVDADKVITAGHCHTPGEALGSSVTFDYRTDCGGARPAGYACRFHKVKAVLGHRFDGFYGAPDYSLLQLATAPAGIPAIQMRHDVPAAGEQVFGVHHPNGAVKKLSLPHPAFDTVAASNAGSVQVHANFHVSGGSSGSGLFDAAGRVVGVLSQGDPCGRAGSPSNLTYFPTAAILLAVAPTPPPPVTRDVMIVVDRSGSMALDDGLGRAKIEAARDAASLFVQLVRAGTGNRAGLVSFSSDATTDAAIAAVTAGSKTTLIGPPPFSGGQVGALAPGGNTSIGAGIEKARLQFPTPGANPRAILLMTDGLQNTPPSIDTVDDELGDIDVHAIGFGSESSLDGEILSDLAAAHDGLYARAGSGLALEKFFSQAFGNIFAAGVLMDPELELPAEQQAGRPQTFPVCGEESLTVVAGWDRADAALLVEVVTPGGAVITPGSPGTEAASGRTWTFLRIPLPHGAERDGAWKTRVFRPGGGEFPPPAPALRYFVNVIPTGGPRLSRLPDRRRYYTGDAINPRVRLRDPDGGWPRHAEVRLQVSRPDAGPGNILIRNRLRAPEAIGADTIPARQATLQALEREAGQPLVRYTEAAFDLGEDAASTGGLFEPAGVFGLPQQDLLAMEGSYTFHARATYGHECPAARELAWSLHVDVGVDPGRTGVTTTPGGTLPDGRSAGTVVLVPRDRYGNHLGPGRGGSLTVTGAAGTTVTGPVGDNGDGSYTVPVAWDPGTTPGVVVGQPGRPPVVVQEPRPPAKDCKKWQILCGSLLLAVLILLLALILAHC